MSELFRRIRFVFHRDRLDAGLAEEMRFHLDMEAGDNRENGMDPDEARYAARRRFGNATLLKEASREAWGWVFLDRLAQDLKYGVRTLRKSPGFTAVAVLTFALGIGINSAVFTLVDAFLFRPAPVAGADRLVSLTDKSDKYSGWPISYPNFLDWKEQNRVFDDMAAYRVGSRVLSDSAGAERVRMLEISEGFFQLLQTNPLLGRDFVHEEHQPGGDPVALLSYELWQRRYQGAASILGNRLSISGTSFTVIGILPPGFRIGPRADVFTSIEQWGRESRASHNSLYGIARLKPGVTVEQASSHMDVIAAGLEQQYPQANRRRRVDILPFGRARVREIQTAMLVLMGAVGLVLLIACANLSNLLLAKASGRGREVAVRKALGASRGRLIRQFLIESLLLAAIGGVAGLLFASWCCQGLLALIGDLDRWPGGEPLGGIHVDARVLAFTMLLTLLAGAIAGLVPAFQVSSGGLTAALKEGSRTGAAGWEGRRVRDVLVTAETALALVLLAGAGILTRALYHLLTLDPGFDARNVLSLSIAQPASRPSKEVCTRLIEELQALPGVDSAALTFPLPFGHGFSAGDFSVEGAPPPSAGRYPSARIHYVSPGYFRVLGLRLVKGRWFTREDEQAAVINQTMARQCWPGEDPVGRRFRVGSPVPNSPWYTVTGVAANTKENGLDKSETPEIYRPVSSASDLLVRTAGPPSAMIAAIRARIRSVDKDLAVYDVVPLDRRISESLWGHRTLTWLLAIFSAAALALAAVGIYGVAAHSIGRRTQEVGIRIALGARPGQVLGMVVAQGMRPVVIGIALGIAGAAAATRALGSMLFGVKPADPLAFGSVAVLLAIVALVACWLPARRATRVDPMEALRYE